MRHIPISSVNTFHGYDIETTQGFVSTHVVTGVNIFSDILSSFSDTFGGRSESSNKQIDSIKQEAIKKLKVEAQNIGGNGIIGVTIDVDEVSGGGKSMFMITASGTAVKVTKAKSVKDINRVSSNRFIQLLTSEELIEKSKDGKLAFNEKNIAEAINCECCELGSYFITKASAEVTHDELVASKVKSLVPYFMSLPIEIAISSAYSSISTNYFQNKVVVELIKHCELFDFNEVNKLIDRKDPEYSSSILNICFYSAKPSYSESDVPQFKSLLNKIESLKVLSLSKYDKKGMLGTKTYWKCICGTEVEEDRISCHSCGSSINGYGLHLYTETEQNITRAVSVLSKTFQSN